MRRSLSLFGVLAAAVALAAATLPAEAQYERRRPQITIKKRSYLDAGTTVKPGERKYHEYAFPLGYNYPTYGPFRDASRWPLPGPFDGLPGNY